MTENSNPMPSSIPSGQPATLVVPQSVIIQQKDGRFSRWFAWLGWIGLLFCLPVLVGIATRQRDYFDTTDGIQEKFVSGNRDAVEKLAIIDVSGVIMEGDGFVKKQINRIEQDPHVKGILVRVDSPGGTVTGSDYIYHHLTRLRKEKKLPLVVSMGSLAASGGYYVAMAVGDQERSIFAEPTTTTGSIGVIIPHYDVSGLMARFDVRDDSIVSHPRKQILSMTKEVSAEDRKVLQEYVNQSFERFKNIVKSGRPKFRDDAAALDQLATGEIFTAEDAEESGLVDEIGFLEDAVERVAELAKVDAAKVRVVRYEQPLSVWQAVGAARSSTTDYEQTLQDWSVPRAFYLFTMLPPLLTSMRGFPMGS
ncbi:MAG TPA: signal peptide peptidase SppA [Pirellulaceae bacterium]